jgi:hypothetical protein
LPVLPSKMRWHRHSKRRFQKLLYAKILEHHSAWLCFMLERFCA